MTNEELCARIQNGERDLLEELLTANKGMANKIAYRYLPSAERNGGLDIDDLRQAARLGLMLAVDAWDAERGEFIDLAAQYMRKEIRAALGIRTSKERIENSGRTCSLFAKVSDEDNTELIELVPDDSCEDPQRAAEIADTRRCVREVVETLPEKQRAAIVGFYFEGKPIKAISQSARRSAFFTLRRNGKLRSLVTRYNDALYHSSGARSFRYTHESAVERAVLQRERILDQINGALPTRRIG